MLLEQEYGSLIPSPKKSLIDSAGDVNTDVTSKSKLTCHQLFDFKQNLLSCCCYHRVYCAFMRCVSDTYFWACFVYLIYTCQALAVDYCEEIKILEHQCQISSINSQYVALAAVHCFNAFQFFCCWAPFFIEHTSLSKSTQVVLLIPEFMNVVEGGMYLFSSLIYSKLNSTKCQQNLECNREMFVHYWETGAAVLEFVASIFWCYSWYVVFKIESSPELSMSEKVRLALFDLELYAALSLVAGSVVYIVYYFQVDEYPDHYDVNTLWEAGDLIYFLGALCYLLSSMKMCGFFYFVKLPGWSDDWSEIDQASYKPCHVFGSNEERPPGS